MSKNKVEKIYVVEHVLEVRHVASGTFLDIRGYIADYIRNNKIFPHWKIDTNVVNFRDTPDKIQSEGAFVGYKSAGYVALDSQTRNYFVDRASSFWKILIKNEYYKIPELTRFGARTKIFMPSDKSFEEINKNVYEEFFTNKARTLLGGKETDLQFIFNFDEDIFNAKIAGGPIHKEEANKFFQFKSEHFKNTGLFLDIDYFKIENITHDKVPSFLKKAIDLTWLKTDKIATGIGI